MPYRRVGLFAVLLAFTAAASYVGSRVAGSGGAVLGAVFGLTLSTLAEAGRRWIDRSAALKQKRASILLSWQETLPEEFRHFWQQTEQQAHSPPLVAELSGVGFSPATMLLPEHTVVPFIGREQELAELTEWCMGETGPLWLLTGAGGTGKTRLACELAARMDGWDCGWLRPGEEADAIDVVRRRGKSLIIVDYAETRDRKKLAKLVWTLAWPPRKYQVRVLLIARAVGDWWPELAAEVPTLRQRTLLQNAGRTRLGDLKRDGQDCREHYTRAVRVFSDRLGAREPTGPMPDLGPSAPVLVIHVAALVAILESGGEQLTRQDEVLTRLLEHEDRYWQRCAESCQLANLSRAARWRSVALLCLTGADNPADAAELLRRVPALADADAERRQAIVAWLQMLYPGGQTRQIGTLQPNLLAEHLVVQELAADRAFRRRALTDLPYGAARYAMTLLARATRHSDQADPILREALAADLANLARPAITAARETDGTLGDVLADVVDAKPMSAKQLNEISAAIPSTSQALHRAAVGIGKKLLEVESAQVEDIDGTQSDIDLRRREDAVVDIEQTAQLFRERAEAEPDVFDADLLKALQLLRAALADLGRTEEAAKVTIEITEIESAGPK
jgi:hypothetical protein